MGKLVRDKIPEIIRKSGKTPVIRNLNDQNYREELGKKLKEEVEEFLEAHDPEELADILEVIYGFAENMRKDFQEIEAIRKNKLEERGSFSKRIYLETVKD
jgi:predicted house-cleaning noncanonical NTP pyrophosphatase (MazG superfamily)